MILIMARQGNSSPMCCVQMTGRQLLFPPRSPAKSQGSGKEQSVELQILSHLGQANKTTPGHLPVPEGCRVLQQMHASFSGLCETDTRSQGVTC